MFSLTTTHLRFICEATTPLRLEVENFRAGSNLRGALGQVMTRTACSASPCAGDWNDPAHTATCPVHWLLAANEKPGQERRGYAIVPPQREISPERLAAHNLSRGDIPSQVPYEPGERFEFGITLFGHALQFLPYFVLAVPEMGRAGVGAGRGKFALKSVWAINPLDGARECLLAENDTLVHTPTLTLNHARVVAAAERLMGNVEIRFLTPMRLIANEELLKAPSFATLFARLLKRLDDLEMQHGGGNRRGTDEVQTLHDLAKQVQPIETETRWVEVWSGSTRRGTPSPMSGFVGRAVYAAAPEVWRALLPWLVWGQLAQVGKDTVKGNGVIAINRAIGQSVNQATGGLAPD